jgi:hypothetical protein
MAWLVILSLFATACAPEGGSAEVTASATNETTPTTSTASQTPPTATTSLPATTTTTIATTTTDTQPDTDDVIDITIEGDSITGGGRQSIELGSEATITITSDRSDEAHLHGYDLSAELQPGVPATLTFMASIPGIFELELEDDGNLIAEIEVAP